MRTHILKTLQTILVRAALGLALLLSAVPVAKATIYNWTGASSSAWATAGNWSPTPGSAPGFGDTVLFGVTNSITSAVTDLGGIAVVVGSNTNKDFYNSSSLFSNAVFQYKVNGATSSYTLTNGTVSFGTSASSPTANFLIGSGVTLNLNATVNSTLGTPGTINYVANTNAILNIGTGAASNGRFVFQALTNGVTATANVNVANFANTSNGRWQIGGNPSGGNKQANLTVYLNASEGLNTSGYLTVGDVSPGYEAKLVVRSNANFTLRGRLQLGGQGTTAAGNGRIVIGDSTSAGYFTNDFTGAGASTIWLKIGAIQNSTGIVDVVNGTFAYPNTGGQSITTQFLPFAPSNNAAGFINIYTNGTFSTVVNWKLATATAGVISGGINFYGGTLQAASSLNSVQGNNLLDANLPVTIYAGGASLDNNGQAMTINANLLTGSGGDGGLSLTGSGVTTLAGVNTYTNATLVKQGTLALASTFSTASSITVSNGATLGFNAGTLASSPTITVADGGAIGSLSLSGGTTMNVNALTLGSTAAGGYANFQFGSGANDSFSVANSGGLTLNGARINLYVEGTTSPFSTPGTYTLFSFSGSLVGNVANLAVNNPADGTTYVFTNTGSAIQVVVGVNGTINQWGVDADGSWSTLANWTLLVPNNSGNDALFGSYITTPRAVGNDVGHTVKKLKFANNNAYTLNGPGAVTLSAVNTNAVVQATIGSHVINADLVLAANTQFDAATNQMLTLAGNITGTNSFQVDTNHYGNIAIVGTNAAPVTVMAGSVWVTNAGLLTQPLTLMGGTTWIDSEANLGTNPATLNTNQLVLNGGTLRSTGNVSISNTNRGITLGTNGGSFGSASGTYTFTINTPIGGSGSLTKTYGGQGMLVLATNNTYTGDTIINYGELQIGTGGASGNLGASANVIISNASALTFNRSNLTSWTTPITLGTNGGYLRNRGTQPITLNSSINAGTNVLFLDTEVSNLVLPGGNITNFGGLVKTNGNALTLTGTLSASTPYGRLSVAGGTLAVASSANWTYTNLNMTRTILLGSAGGSGGSMIVSNGAVLNVTGLSVGNANNSTDCSFELNGGTVNLLGWAGDVVYLHESGNTVNSYSLTVNSGTLNVPDPGSRVDIGYKGAATFTVNDGTVNLNRAGFGAVGGTMTSSSALGGVDMYSTLTINGGSLNISNQLELCSDSTANAGVYRHNTITLNGGTLRTVAANITTPAAAPNVVLNLNGGSVVALGAGGYNGTLANFFAGAGTVNVANTNTLDCGAYNLTITNALVGGAADLIKAGSGSLTLNGVNTYTGSTVVSNGTLAGNGSFAGPVALRSGTKLAPGGASIGVLTVGNDLTLNAGASASFRINTTNAVATNDYLVVTGTQSISSSTLTVTNLGPALNVGDTFKLLSNTGAAAGFTTLNLPSDYTWTNKLAIDGTIQVLTVPTTTPNPTNITYSVSGSQLVLNWPAGQGWRLQVQTNGLTTGLTTNWSAVTPTPVPPLTNTVDPAIPTVFYRLVYP